MKKYSKKVALILVLTLVLATAIPALAVGRSTTITGEYEDVEIAVSVPSTISATLNPYGLPVKVFADDTTTEIATLKTPGQVATQPIVGANLSDIKLSVGASVTATPSGGFSFAQKKEDVKNKAGMVWLQMQQVKKDLAYQTTPDTETAVCGFTGTNVVTQMNSWKLPTKYSATDKASLLITSAATGSSKEAMCTLLPIKNGAPDPKGGCFMARLVGDIVKKQSDPDNDWDVQDGFTLTITWTFEPA